MGACPKCDGLGNITFFDPQRIVAFPIFLSGGAIKGWDNAISFITNAGQSGKIMIRLERPLTACGRKLKNSTLRQWT